MDYNKSMFMKESIDQNNSLRLNSSMKALNRSYYQSFKSPRDELDVNKISEILSLVDLSHFLIQCIKQENDIIRNTIEFEYKSMLNYHKIKEIDLIKLLVIAREKISINIKNVLISNSCFFTEVKTRIEKLDELLKNCFFLQVNDEEVNEDFNLSSEMVDAILNDCNTDLLELETVLSKILQEWRSKLKRGQQFNNRNERLSHKIIDSLNNDVIKSLQRLSLILERLFYGYSHTITNISNFKLAQDFLLEFCNEIDERQYQYIVNLKLFHYELEQKTLTQILELKEIQNKLNLYDIKEIITSACKLPSINVTPISQRNASILTSTPYFSHNIHNIDHISTYFNNIISDGDDDLSVISLDSGILPITENDVSLTTSRDTLDILPFPDEEYEKIEENKFENQEFLYFDDSDCFGSVSTNSEREIQCSSIIDHKFFKRSKNENTFVKVKGFKNFDNIINSFQLTKKQKEDFKRKINYLISCETTNFKFNWALRVTIYISKDNPSNDLLMTLEYLEKTFFSYMNMYIQDIPVKCNWNTNFNRQDNNNACSPNFLKKISSDFGFQNDQNTNNNANSKDDDVVDHNIDSDDPLDDNQNYIGNDVQLAFINGVDVSSSEFMVDNAPEDQIIYDGVIKCGDWQQYDSMMADKTLLVDYNAADGSLFLEDIDLALRLSELHLKSEFENEQYNNNVILKTKGEIIKNYENVRQKVNKKIEEFNVYQIQEHNDLIETFNKIKGRRFKNCNNDQLKESEKEQLCDTIEEIDDELKTEFCSEDMVDISQNSSQIDTSSIADDVKDQSVSDNLPHDNDSLSFSQRISLTINLSESLLNITHDRLNHISSVLKNRNICVDPKMISAKILSIYSLRKRLCAIINILSNLKYSIKFSYNSEEILNFITAISDLISDSESLTKFSYNLEDWIKKNNLKVDNNITDTDYLHELPNDLLVKLDNIDTESIISVSIQRLHATIFALSYYPCYNTLLKSSFKKYIKQKNILLSTQSNRRMSLSNSELVLDIHKLRRVAAICALNIVDLHVVIARTDEDPRGDNGKKLELKDLLAIWGVVDKECHRLLRCNSLIQHVLMDTRRTYIEIISLSAIILSIMRTVDLSSTELAALTQHMDNINIYKLKIKDWLEEVEICSTVIHKKRITHTRFKCYEDIYNYLEENLNSISELSSSIKLGCQKSVKSLATIITYCSDMPSCSVKDIDTAFNTKNVIGNHRYLCSLNDENNFIKNGIINAIIELEITENKISYFQDLLDKSKEVFLILVGENISSEVVSYNEIVDSEHILDKEEHNIQSNVIENAAQNLSDKVSAIATCTASKAILLFIENNNRVEKTDSTDQQVSNWTSVEQDNMVMNDAVETIVDNVTAMMTALLFQKVLVNDDIHIMIYCKIMFNDIASQIGDKALHFLVDNVMLNLNRIDDKSNDLEEYFTEELSHTMLNDCIFSLSESPPKKSSFLVSCISKLQRKTSHRLLEKSTFYIANLASSYINTSLYNLDICHERRTQHLTEYLNDLSLPISTYRLSKKIQPELVSPRDVLTNFSKMLKTNVLSLKEYKSEIRKCLNVDCKLCMIIPRIISDRVSKLVAHFDRSALENEMLRDQKTERICFNSVQVNTNTVIRELINGILEDLPLYERGNDCLCSRKSESLNSFSDITSEFPNSFIIQNVMHSSETYNPDNIDDLEETIQLNIEMKCLEELHVGETQLQSLLPHQNISVSERIFNESKSFDVATSQDTVLEIKLVSSKYLNKLNKSLVECFSGDNRHFSSISLSNYSQGHLKDDEVIFISSESEMIDIDLEESNDVQNEVSSDMQSESMIANTAEIIEKSNVNDDMYGEIDYTKCKCTFFRTTNEKCVYQNSTMVTSNVIYEKLNTQNKIYNDNLNNMDCLSSPTITTLSNGNNMEQYYEQSLSKLWLFICGFILMIMVLIIFYDHISHVCNCLSSFRWFLPKVVSSGLPF